MSPPYQFSDGHQIQPQARRALDQLREFELEPRSTALAAHSVQPLRRDRAELVFVNFYPVASLDGPPLRS